MTAVQAVVEQWRKEGVALNGGADESSLAELEDTLGVRLPADVAQYFSEADGMVDPGPDEHMANFWSVRRIRSQAIVEQGRDRLGAYRDVAFADVLIDSWFIYLRVRDERAVSVLCGATREECASLEEFFRRYLANPGGLGL